MQKRGDVWISAILYLGFGIVIIGLLLAGATPLINNIRDRNTASQSKQLLLTLDQALRSVSQEGPGSQRELAPFTVGKGKITIDATSNIITWEVETSARLMEPNTPIQEGILSLNLATTPQADRFIYTAALSYSYLQLKLTSPFGNTFTGTYTLLVRHSGSFVGNNPIIEIQVS